jgi:DNA-binding MarR family transcriptional regulator
MKWDAVSFVMSSKMRFRVLILLNKSHKTPSELKLEIGTQISNISKTLKELEKAGLIKCLTPERRKAKFYGITEDGIRILDEINKITKTKQ